MDKDIEIRRRINYVTDLIQKSDAIIKNESKDDYFEYYQNYKEVVAYLNRVGESLGKEPGLIKPNIFNKRLGGLWTVTVLGLLNPFIAILIFTMTFPISFPYLVARAIALNRTKKRIEEAKIYLTRIVNSFKEQQVEMTDRLTTK